MSRKNFSRDGAGKDAWLAERTAKVEHAQEQLKRGLTALVTSDDWTALLARIGKSIHKKLSAGRYSFRNQILLSIAAGDRGMPQPSLVATYEAWKRAGRQVKRGEKSLCILQPKPCKGRDRVHPETGETIEGKRFALFVPLSVFDVSQTDGEPLAEAERITVDVQSPEGFAESADKLRAVALALGGGTVVSSVEIREATGRDPVRVGGWFDRITKEIVVINRAGSAQTFKTLVHEIAHAILHGGTDHHSAPEMEVEAESTAYVVCSALGLDTAGYSFPYVATWAKRESCDPATAVARSGDKITKAATTILDALVGAIEVDATDENQPIAKQAAA
jgi:hypothetical protein